MSDRPQLSSRRLGLRLLAALGLIASATLASYVIDRAYLAEFEERREVSEALNTILATTSDQLVYLTQIRDAIGVYLAADDRNGLQRSLPALEAAVAALRAGVATGAMAPESREILQSPLYGPLPTVERIIETGTAIAGDDDLWGAPSAYEVAVAGRQILEVRPMFRRIREIENADLDRLAARMELWRKGGVAIVLSLLLVVWTWNFRPLLRRLRAERIALRNQWQRAEDASAAKSTFISTLSHEIRTPLVGILGAADLLRDSTDDRDRDDLAGTILTSGRSLLAVLNDILEFTKVEAGRVEIVQAPVDLAAMAGEIRALFRSSACAKGLTLALEISGPLAPAYLADGGRLRQVLINLVGNAVKFTDAGAISIRLAARAAGSGRHALRIEVADTGIGISEHEISAMFEAFRQANGSAERRHEGTGLGLAIARRLAEALGGTLTVVSRPGAGSTFTLALDLAVAAELPAPAEPARPATPPADRKGLAVLVVDDNATNRMIARRMLSKSGCAIAEAASGAEAIEAAERRRPDLIMMDVSMPGMDGYEAMRRIREAQSSLRHAPSRIVAVSAHAGREHEVECLMAGMDGILPKPYSRADVEILLSALPPAGQGRVRPVPQAP